MRRVSCAAAVLLALSVGHAQRLPDDIVIPHHYDLTFAPDFADDTFRGTARIEVEVRRATRTIVLNALDLALQDVRVIQQSAMQTASVQLDRETEQASLTLERALAPGPATIELGFAGKLATDLLGVYLSRSSARKYAATQFETTHARRAFPAFDEPVYKATFRISAVVDSTDTAISNGAIVSDTPGPGAGKHTLMFATTAKMSTYLVALAIGDFQCLSGGADGIPIRVCATPDKVRLGRFALAAAEESLRYFNRYFEIDYPFGKLDIVALPDFEAGAMENTGAIFGRELMLTDEQRAPPSQLQIIALLISHEIVHHWFGNLVTMRWWDDIWLNEGFATWMEQKPVHAWKPEWRVAAVDVRRSRISMATDALETARPIRTRVDRAVDTEQLFDALVYGKAGAVLQMTEQYLGDDTFRRGVNAYVNKYAYSNATADGFWEVMAQTTGRPVDRIMRSFVDQSGVPVVSVTATCHDGRTSVGLYQQRFLFNPGAPSGSSTWSVPVCLKSDGSVGCDLMDQAEQVRTLQGCNRSIFANPSARGYYVTAYDTSLLKTIAASAGTSLNDEERAVFIDDVWALVRNGRYQIGDFLNVLQLLKDQLASGDWDITAFRLTYIHDNLVLSTSADAHRRWIRQLLQPAFIQLGWDVRPDDSVERRALRGAVILALGQLGGDGEVLAEAKRRVERYLLNESGTDPMLLDTVMILASLEGDTALHARLRARALSGDSPVDARRAMLGLTRFTTPELISRSLEFAVSEARTQDVPYLLGSLLRNRSSRDLAWSFVKERWSQVRVKTEGPFGSIVSATNGFCDTGLRNDVEQFFTVHPLTGSDRPLREALESMDNCIRMRTHEAPHLAAWLQAF